MTYGESPPSVCFVFSNLPLLTLLMSSSGVVGDWSVNQWSINPQSLCSSRISLIWWICDKSGYLALDVLHCAMFFPLVGEWKISWNNAVSLSITKTVVSFVCFCCSDSKLGPAEVWTSRQALQDLYQKMLVTDLEYALDKKVEQDL